MGSADVAMVTESDNGGKAYETWCFLGELKASGIWDSLRFLRFESVVDMALVDLAMFRPSLADDEGLGSTPINAAGKL